MRTNDLFLTAAAASLMMFAACTHDDDSSTVTTTPTIASNEIVVSTRHSGMAITRAESNIQEEQFDASEYIDVFLQDNDNPTTGSQYDNPIRYKTNGSGGLKTYTYTTAAGVRTYDTEDDNHINRLFWPKLMHDLNIFGVYPEGTISTTTKHSEDSYDPFTLTTRYWFEVAADQTNEANTSGPNGTHYDYYKHSDLMTGLPTTYYGVTNQFTLDQTENPGVIPLTFTHRLTKIIVNVTKTLDTEDTDIPMSDIIYDTSSGPDLKFARVTLVNTKRRIWFKVYDTNADASHQDLGGLGTATGDDKGDIVIVGRGKTIETISLSLNSIITLSDGSTTPGISTNDYNAVTLSAIIPPQTITEGTNFIKVELIDNTGNESGTDHIVNTFYYAPTANMDLAAKNVYTFNIRINKPHIDVTTKITSWEPNDPTNAIGVLQ